MLQVSEYLKYQLLLYGAEIEPGTGGGVDMKSQKTRRAMLCILKSEKNVAIANEIANMWKVECEKVEASKSFSLLDKNSQGEV